jgi:nucleotide-binding universal stress UspA family protein
VPQLLGNVLNEILDAYPDLEGRADWCIRSGDTGAELAELAAASRAAAIVVGTGGQGLLRAAVTRSPASLLARAATVPVVISRHETD